MKSCLCLCFCSFKFWVIPTNSLNVLVKFWVSPYTAKQSLKLTNQATSCCLSFFSIPLKILISPPISMYTLQSQTYLPTLFVIICKVRIPDEKGTVQ